MLFENKQVQVGQKLKPETVYPLKEDRENGEGVGSKFWLK
jgi:hypothetical protein